MINFVHPRICQDSTSRRAGSVQNYDLADARRFFNSYSNDYFKHLYFALARADNPALQQHRSHAISTRAFMANRLILEHEPSQLSRTDASAPESITENILKTRPTTLGTSTLLRTVPW